MSMQNGQRKRALLIGIDRYNSTIVPDLSGCLKDVELMETCLKRLAGISNISKLTSPAISEAQKNQVSLSHLPTYKNVVNELERFAAEAQEGDFIYIHFSGHGSRLPTNALRSYNLQDECLVLVREDPSGNKGRVGYLRDVEFAYLLKQISDKGATITIVLDCCHSGGASRSAFPGGGHESSVPRGVESLPDKDIVVRPPICNIHALESFRTSHANGSTRGASVMPHWLTSSRGVEFLAACRANQKAHEVQLGEHKGGLLTECLLSVLQGYQADRNPLTCDMIYNLVSRKVTSHPKFTPPQDVVFGGERCRFFFGTDRTGPRSTTITSLTRLSDEGLQIKLSVGGAHGVAKTDVYAIYPPDRTFTSLMDYNSPSAVCRISQVEDFASTGLISPNQSGVADVRINCKAVRQGEILRHHVLARRPIKLLLPVEGGAWTRQSMKDIEKLLSERSLVRLVDSPPSFTVRSHSPGHFKITVNHNGGSIRSEATVEVKSQATLASYLNHLVLYYNLLDLSGPSAYNNGLSVEKLGFLPRGVNACPPRRYDPNAPPFDGLRNLDNSDPQTIGEGESIGIRVRNKGQKPMFITILDLEPSWKATRLYPMQGNAPTQILPGEATDFYITMYLPESVVDAVQPSDFDTIIVLATTDERENFPVDILPQLDQTPELFSSPLGKFERTRGGKPTDEAQWYAQRVDIRVIRRPN